MIDTKELRIYQRQLNETEDERDTLRAELNEIRYGVAVAHDMIKALCAKIEAAEKEREIDEQRIADLMAELNRVGHENDNLRAKVAEMEQQEPVATVIKEGDSRYWMSERLWTFPNGKYPLYALPGAQGEEE